MAEETVQDIDEQIDLVKQRFRQVIEQIRTVLHTDVAQFVEREARRAFLANPDVAERLADDRVAELKRRAKEAGARAADTLREDLEDESLWLTRQGTPEDPRSLAASEGVWTHVRKVEDVVRDLLADFDLAADRPTYKAPVYFVSGLFLPSLVEHYWKLLEELASLERRKEAIHTDTVRERLVARWEEA
ncbi:MAG: hypothetical protein ACQEXJ_17165 [Myxococcota bacterium]